MSETVTLTDAMATTAHEGALFHARCVLEAVDVWVVKLLDGDATLAVGMSPDKIGRARELVGADVVAMLLLEPDDRPLLMGLRWSGWRLLAIRTPSEHELWWFTRAQGVTMRTLFEHHRTTFEAEAITKPGAASTLT